MVDEKTPSSTSPMAEKDKGVDRAAAADRAVVARNAATDGATSVAEAVKRVADAAVAAVQKTETVPGQDFIFSGTPNGQFEIRGKGFSTNGTVKVNGHQARTTGWGDDRIVGHMPDGVRSGTASVEVAVDSETVKHGTFRV